MKVARTSWRGTDVVRDIKDAIANALTPDPYSYDGQLEKMDATLSNIKNMVGSLVQMLNENHKLSDDQVMDLLGYGWDKVQNKD